MMGQSSMKKDGNPRIYVTLKRHLKRFNIYQGETLPSFQHGETVNSLKKGNSLESTMYLAYHLNC